MATTYYESSDDGYISKLGSSTYNVYDYDDVGSGVYCILSSYFTGTGAYVPTEECRAYKRFEISIPVGQTITLAYLYFYLDSIANQTAQLGCKLEQIDDYNSLGSADWNITVKHDYGNVMVYNEAAGWKQVDVTTELEASKTDSVVAFRWRIPSAPDPGEGQGFNIRAYENSLKAYLVVFTTEGSSPSPSSSPSLSPSDSPSNSPSASPSNSPSVSASNSPSASPSNSPSASPSAGYDPSASESPSSSPSSSPSASPSNSPSISASNSPSRSPSMSPSSSPSVSPSASPSNSPSASPSEDQWMINNVKPSKINEIDINDVESINNA